MSYQVKWHTPKNIIKIDLAGDITMQDVHELYTITTQLAHESRYQVHVLLDMRSVTSFPTSLMRLSRALGVVDNNRFGWFLIISSDPVLRFLMTTLGKLIKARFRMFSEDDTAFDFLATAVNDAGVSRQLYAS